MAKFKISEYDAFGPWIYLIDEEHPLPPLFSEYRYLANKALMMFKIPRKISRREANASMHLYDRVVCIMESHMLILDRIGNRVEKDRIDYRNIQAVRNYMCLLRGDLTIYTDNRVVTIEYNTVSEEIISDAVDLIKELQDYKTKLIELKSLDYSHTFVGYLFHNLLNMMSTKNPDTKLIAYQPDIKLPVKKGIWGKIVRLFTFQKVLQNTAFVGNLHELIIISRSSHTKLLKDTDYSYTFLYLPYEKLKTLSIEANEEEPSLRKLVYGTKNYTFETSFDDSSKGIDTLYDVLKKPI